jgi:hypothetical protein
MDWRTLQKPKQGTLYNNKIGDKNDFSDLSGLIFPCLFLFEMGVSAYPGLDRGRHSCCDSTCFYIRTCNRSLLVERLVVRLNGRFLGTV